MHLHFISKNLEQTPTLGGQQIAYIRHMKSVSTLSAPNSVQISQPKKKKKKTLPETSLLPSDGKPDAKMGWKPYYRGRLNGIFSMLFVIRYDGKF